MTEELTAAMDKANEVTPASSAEQKCLTEDRRAKGRCPGKEETESNYQQRETSGEQRAEGSHVETEKPEVETEVPSS